MHIPKLGELFLDPHPVIAAFLARLEDDPYGYWYPIKGEDADMPEVCRLFREMQKRFGHDDLTGGMPLMRYQPVRDTPDVMLMREYVEDVHEPLDMKSDEKFRARRASFGPSHPEVRDVGSSYFYGGFLSRFDERAVMQGPMFAGEKCVLRSSSKTIGPALYGDRVLLNTGATCVRTIVGSGSQVDSKEDIKDSIIGRDVYVMAGAVLKHREGLNGKRIEGCPRLKMGCVIADGCHIGANAVLSPGTILMPGCRVPDGTVLPTGVYDQASINRIARIAA